MIHAVCWVTYMNLRSGTVCKLHLGITLVINYNVPMYLPENTPKDLFLVPHLLKIIMFVLSTNAIVLRER